VQTVEVDPLPPTKEGGRPEPVNMAWDEFLLTGDANLIRAHWALRYTISDPWQFQFGYANTKVLLASEFRHAIVRTAAEYPIDRALRSDVESFRAAVQDALTSRVAKLKLGVAVERVDLPGLRPPQPVAEAFDDVVRAENTRSERISEAKAYANRRLAEAFGEASKRRSEAAAYRQRLVSETQSDAAYFERIYPSYRNQPGTVARTLLQDTLRRALAQTDQKYLLYRRDDGQQELRLWLGPERAKAPEPLQTAPKDAKDR
jgi:membrane protease subunit HflK